MFNRGRALATLYSFSKEDWNLGPSVARYEGRLAEFEAQKPYVILMPSQESRLLCRLSLKVLVMAE